MHPPPRCDRSTACHPEPQVVFVATECGPWCKVGGLADVLAALPPALAARGHEVLTVVPRYAPYTGVEPTGVSVPLELPPLPVRKARPAAAAAASGASGAEQAGSGDGDEEMADAAAEAGGEAAAAQDPAAAAAAAEEGPGCGSGGGGTGGDALPAHADLWQCLQGGVRRLFVDHPLFTSA
ncbi:hypothetical protein CHLNCDRAFT_54504, partial [Chlorella variabilis]